MESRVHRQGLTLILGDGEPDSKARVCNIVFVHGLMGHPYKTWAGKQSKPARQQSVGGVRSWLSPKSRRVSAEEARESASGGGETAFFWPEGIAKLIPQARVWTYGYIADVVGGSLTASGSKNTIFEHSEDFKVKLERDVRNTDAFIFVAHSLGGVLVKDALVLSPSCRQRTRAIAFLGTPHRGSSAADLAETARKITNVCLIESNKAMIRGLAINSAELSRSHVAFVNVVEESGIKVHSFIEGRGVSGVKGLSGKIVDNTSSRLGLSSTYETVETVQETHTSMCKCDVEDREREPYKAYCNVLQDFVNGIGEHRSTDFVAAVQSRNDPQVDVVIPDSNSSDGTLDLRKTTIRQALQPTISHGHGQAEQWEPETLHWVLEHPAYLSWDTCKQSILLIRGMAGSGKSVLAAHIAGIQEQQQTALVCRYFFNTALSEIRTGVAAQIMNSIIWQVITKRKKLLRRAQTHIEEYDLSVRSSVDDLWLLCKSILTHQRTGQVVIVLDGLDETKDESCRKLLDRLIGLISRNKRAIRLIVSARSNTPFERYAAAVSGPSGATTLQLGDEPTNRDIDAFLTVRLAVVQRMHNLRPKRMEEFKAALSARAGGSFLWVALVIDSIIEWKSSAPVNVRNTVESIPQNLEQLYSKILENIPQQDMPHIQKLLCLLMTCARTLTLDELAVLVSVDRRHRSYAALEDFLEDQGSIYHALGPLVRIIDGRVDLIHATLKEYLSTADTARVLSVQSWGGDAGSFDQSTIAEACIRYLSFNDFDGRDAIGRGIGPGGEPAANRDVDDDEQMDFFGFGPGHLFWESEDIEGFEAERTANHFACYDYATRYWSTHLNSCTSTAKERLQPLALELCSVRKRHWFEYLRACEPGTSRYPRQPDPLVLAAHLGLDFLVKEMLSAETPEAIRDKAIYWASADGHPRCLQILLAHARARPHRGHTPARPALTVATANAQLDCVNELLEHRASAQNDVYTDLEDAFRMAIERGNLAVLDVLLQQPDLQLPTPIGGFLPPLILAIKSGHMGVVMPLLGDERLDRYQADSLDRTALSWSCIKGQRDTFEALQRDAGSLLNKPDRSGKTALMHAVESDSRDIVELLLADSRVDLTCRDGTGRTATSWAADRGNAQMVRLLLQRSPESACSPDESGWMPVAWTRNAEVAALLLAAMSDDAVRQKDFMGFSLVELAKSWGPATVPAFIQDGRLRIEN